MFVKVVGLGQISGGGGGGGSGFIPRAASTRGSLLSTTLIQPYHSLVGLPYGFCTPNGNGGLSLKLNNQDHSPGPTKAKLGSFSPSLS